MSPEPTTSRLGLRLTPHGHLLAEAAGEAPSRKRVRPTATTKAKAAAKAARSAARGTLRG